VNERILSAGVSVSGDAWERYGDRAYGNDTVQDRR
jgi:hypothetical protein